MMSRTERAALVRLYSTPAEWNTAEWNNARGSLANAVPDLVSDLEQLRTAGLAAVAWSRETCDDIPAPVAELGRLVNEMGADVETGDTSAQILDRVRSLLTESDWSGVLYDEDVLGAIAEAVGVERQD
jgi:hypothetical protein